MIGYSLSTIWEVDLIGIMSNYWQDSEQALTYLRRALEYYQQIQDQASMARAYMNIGNALRKRGDFSQAEHGFLSAETVFMRIGDTLNLARAHHNLGMTYTRLNQGEEAERCFQRALEQWQLREDQWNYANTLGELAEMHLTQGHFSAARHVLDEEAPLIESRHEAPYQALQRELEIRRQKLPLNNDLPESCDNNFREGSQ